MCWALLACPSVPKPSYFFRTRPPILAIITSARSMLSTAGRRSDTAPFPLLPRNSFSVKQYINIGRTYSFVCHQKLISMLDTKYIELTAAIIHEQFDLCCMRVLYSSACLNFSLGIIGWCGTIWTQTGALLVLPIFEDYAHSCYPWRATQITKIRAVGGGSRRATVRLSRASSGTNEDLPKNNPVLWRHKKNEQF